MPDHLLRLTRDDFDANAALDEPLPPAIRAIYVADGMASVRTGGGTATLSANSALFHTGTMSIAARAEGACLLRYELDPGQGVPAGEGVRSELKLEAALRLDDPDGYLLRCDKVELPPGGIAYTHTHQGGGIRCLLEAGSTSGCMTRRPSSAPTTPGSRPAPTRSMPGRRTTGRGISRGR